MNINNFHITSHIGLLLNSYYKWTGKNIIELNGTPEELTELVINAPFALVSHNTETDPVFNFGNKTALRLFELDLEEFTKLHSKESAEALNREDRERLLKRVTEKGYINDYRGIRISSTGKRFEIKDATVWNIVDDKGIYRGQAAFFDKWKFL